MLLRIPSRQVTNITSAEWLRAIVLQIGLSDRTEKFNPLLFLIQLERVIHHVSHFMPEIAQDISFVEPFDVPNLFRVHRQQFGPGQVERDSNRDRSEWHTPLRREIEPRTEVPNPNSPEFLLEFFDQRFESCSGYAQTQISKRR
jgi:hypothetical protein